MRLVLSFFWNWWVQYHAPVSYHSELLNTEVITKKDDIFQYVMEVRQIRYNRNPKPPFVGKVIYVYHVTQYVFKDKHPVKTISKTMPEFSGKLFRNTRVPYVLAVNAFLELIEGECNE